MHVWKTGLYWVSLNNKAKRCNLWINLSIFLLVLNKMGNLRNNCCHLTNLCLSRNNDEMYHTTCFRSIFRYIRLKALYCSVHSLSFIKTHESTWVKVIRQKHKWNIPKVCQGVNVLCPGNKMLILITTLYLDVAC